jgi:PAS domain S-box-containing protein
MLFETTPVGLALCRMDGGFVEVNPAYAQITGHSVDDLLNCDYWELTPEKYDDQERKLLEALKDTGRYGPYEKEYIHKDGHLIPVRLSGRLIERAGQRYIWSAVEDITAVRQTEILSFRLNRILDQTFDEIYIFNGNSLKFVQVSKGALENLGYSAEEILELTPVDLKPDFTLATFEELLIPLRNGERQLLVFESRHRRKDGSFYPVEVRLQFASEATRPVFFAVILDLTERNQSLEALRKSEERYMLAAQIGHSGAWEIWPKEGKILFDGNLTRLLGYEEHELSENLADWIATVPEYVRDKVSSAMQAVIDGRSDSYLVEHPVCRKDGSIGWVFVQGQLVSDPDAANLRLVGSSVDITERKRAEEALQLTQFSLDHAPESVFWIQQDGSMSYVNEEACRSLGYSREELIGLHVWDIDPDFLEEQWPAQWESTRRMEQKTFERRHREKCGRIHPVEISVVHTLYGDVEQHTAFVRDITERKCAEAAIKQLNEDLEDRVEQRTAMVKLQAQIIDQTHDSIVTTDLEGYVDSWNRGAERLFGVPTDDAIGRHVSFIYPEQEQEFLLTEVVPTLKEKGQHETEVRMRRADGSVFYAHLSLSMLCDDRGSPRGMVGYSIDISELKQREQKLNELAQRLGASNRELEAFSYSVSHDLRAPLRAIDGFSLTLLEDYGDRLDETAHDYLKRVRNGAQRMGQLIDDLLQLSRVNRGELNLQAIDMSKLADEVVSELRAGEPTRKLEWYLDPDLIIQGDLTLVRVMLDNLLGNAWKFSSSEPISKISFGRKADMPTVYYVQDNGVGFDMRYVDKLFGAFQRLHQESEFPGTGIGLATVQRIVNRHGGRVWAEAQENQGATFYFTFESDTQYE